MDPPHRALDARPAGDARAPAGTQAHASPQTGATTPRLPDFFIVGHPKCGTTALYEMLRSHPQVFMPDNKEPRFFAPDTWSRFLESSREEAKRLLTPEGYAELFSAARPDQRIGEATTSYLRSELAARRIAETLPDARIIALLREPVAFLRSYHLQLLNSGVETESDFGRALALEPERREGRSIPPKCHVPSNLLYSEQVRYVEQLRRYHDAFPAEQVLVLVYEDYRADNAATVARVLRFLALDDAEPVEQVETKKLKGVRSVSLHQLAGGVRVARRNPAAATPLTRGLGHLAPLLARSDTIRALWRRAVYTAPAPADEGLERELRNRYKPEVQAISEYLSRDLVGLWGYGEIG